MLSVWDSTNFKHNNNEWNHFAFVYRSVEMDDLNCTLPAILEFPNFMRQKSWVATVMCFFLSMYLFIVLAIVCDEYLVPAMERLCYTLRMTYDVAGATFLAAATSAPELFVAFVGTFITHGDIGVGTIVGSSVFNILVIAAVCGILTPPSKLDWWPISRDTIWYLVAIASLTIVLWDSLVKWLWFNGHLQCYWLKHVRHIRMSGSALAIKEPDYPAQYRDRFLGSHHHFGYASSDRHHPLSSCRKLNRKTEPALDDWPFYTPSIHSKW
ncbi:sodium/potassium/calcium exchanger 4 isoform X4 [Drosophila takahashii]|uniref:sodium/potassium/calcium exchanger 4 isoform X4 n=1 Tax=Drosophila takahashii TaxID=29030 RepID=UPI0038992E3E